MIIPRWVTDAARHTNVNFHSISTRGGADPHRIGDNYLKKIKEKYLRFKRFFFITESIVILSKRAPECSSSTPFPFQLSQAKSVVKRPKQA